MFNDIKHSYLADQAGDDGHLDEQRHDLYNEAQSLSGILDKESIYLTIFVPDYTECCSLPSLKYRWFSLPLMKLQNGEKMQNDISVAEVLEEPGSY